MENKFNAVIGQSGGPTSAINATLAGVIKGCLDEKSIDKVYGMRNGVEGFLAEKLTDLEGYFENREALELLSLTPASALSRTASATSRKLLVLIFISFPIRKLCFPEITWKLHCKWKCK